CLGPERAPSLDTFSSLSFRFPQIGANLPLAPSLGIHDEPIKVGGMPPQVRLELRRRVRLRLLYPEGEERLAPRRAFPPVPQFEDAVRDGTQKLFPSKGYLVLDLDEI